MDLTLSEAEGLVQSSARDFLSREITTDVVAAVEESHAFPRTLWQRLAGQGWFGVATPPAQGGSGGSLVDWALLLVELGRVACPAPVAEHLAAAIYLGACGASGRSRLGGVLSGETVATVAGREQPGRPVRVSDGAGRAGASLSGAMMLVPYAGGADLLLAAPSEGGYYAVDRNASGVTIKQLHTVSRDQHGLVELSATPAELLGRRSEDLGADLLELYRFARDAYAVGLLGRILDVTVNYTRERVQFGRPIGSFQAVQYRCVDIALAAYGAQHHIWQCAWLLANGRPARRELLMCHIQVREALGQATMNAHQAHGAMGFTDAYPLQLFTRRAKVYQHAYGTAAQFREQLAELDRNLVTTDIAEPLFGGFL